MRPVEDAASLAAEEERADPARLERRPGPPLDLADERESLARPRLEVEVVGSGGAAAGTVVEGEGARERLGEIQEDADLAGDPLRPVLAVDDGEVAREDREGVAEEGEVGAERNAPLLRREVLRAEEAGALGD